jgi:hypothetical protein
VTRERIRTPGLSEIMRFKVPEVRQWYAPCWPNGINLALAIVDAWIAALRDVEK